MVVSSTVPASNRSLPTVVDFPWSTCPINTMFMCGFVFAIVLFLLTWVQNNLCPHYNSYNEDGLNYPIFKRFLFFNSLWVESIYKKLSFCEFSMLERSSAKNAALS